MNSLKLLYREILLKIAIRKIAYNYEHVQHPPPAQNTEISYRNKFHTFGRDAILHRKMAANLGQPHHQEGLRHFTHNIK